MTKFILTVVVAWISGVDNSRIVGGSVERVAELGALLRNPKVVAKAGISAFEILRKADAKWKAKEVFTIENGIVYRGTNKWNADRARTVREKVEFVMNKMMIESVKGHSEIEKLDKI